MFEVVSVRRNSDKVFTSRSSEEHAILAAIMDLSWLLISGFIYSIAEPEYDSNKHISLLSSLIGKLRRRTVRTLRRDQMIH